MRILILGGTVFLGRHIVESALARGHDLTLFHRGIRGRDLFPEVQRVFGDRDGGIDALSGRTFDAVIDTSGYLPRVVRQSAEFLKDRAGLYVFVSSISAYRDLREPGTEETAPLAELPPDAPEDIGTWYGALKAACEAAVWNAFPGRAQIIRPGLIVGPHDPSDRFAYWVRRLAKGGEVLAPGDPERQVQVIDVRDLAAWMVTMAERGETGPCNAVGPERPLTMGALLETCRDVAHQDAHVTWVAEDFILASGVVPWTELPLWIPASEPDAAGMDRVSIARALQTGLRFRPLADTVRDTLAWDGTRPDDLPRRAGLSRARETEVLRAWHGGGR